MNAKELNEEAMDMVVGGSCYKEKLADFISTNSLGYRNFTIERKHNNGSTETVSRVQSSAENMNNLLHIAEKYGHVTLVANNGTTRDFSYDELNGMK